MFKYKQVQFIYLVDYCLREETALSSSFGEPRQHGFHDNIAFSLTCDEIQLFLHRIFRKSQGA